jgi:hypothetical protein
LEQRGGEDQREVNHAGDPEMLIGAAVEDPDGFRLLFQHAAREPGFRQQIDAFQASVAAAAYRQLVEIIGDASWARWAAHLAPMVTVEAIIAWLDVSQPDRARAADRIRQVLVGVILAAGGSGTGMNSGMNAR